jgi:hypothetical protein
MSVYNRYAVTDEAMLREGMGEFVSAEKNGGQGRD